MLQYLCNAFNDPSNPWYYVIGLLFLLAIFGALAAYVILSGKKKKDGAEKKDEQTESTDTEQTNNGQSSEPKAETDGTDTVSDPQDQSDQ